MNRFKLSKAGINVNEGLKRFGGDLGSYEALLNKFHTDAHFQTMCAAINEGDAQTAFAAGHAIKGVVGNLSMNRLYDGMVLLVEALRAGDIQQAKDLLPAVTRDYNDVITALSE